MSDDETKVFTSAKPVSPASLVGDETETKAETPGAETKKSPQAKGADQKQTGVPAWHLSLTLGLVIALAGGVLLWLQSPALAVLVIGGLVLLVGLSLALRHFFGRPKSQQQGGNQSRGNAGNPTKAAGGTPSQSQSRRPQRRETDPETRKSPSRRAETGRETSRRPRETKTETERPRSQRRETGPPAPQRPRETRQQPPAGGRTPQGGRAPGGNTTPAGGRTPQGARTQGGGGVRPQGSQQNALGGSSGGIPPRPLKNAHETAPVCIRGIEPANPKSPKALDESKIKENGDEKQFEKLGPVDDKAKSIKSTTSLEVVEPKEAPKPEEVATPETKEDVIVWPNVDVDDPRHLPRITMVRQAKRLPPIYHRKGEPSWPTDDPDRHPVTIPPQRDRRGTVATPDQLTSTQRTAHYANAATTATKLAGEKERQAYTLISQADELDGVEGMELVREDKLANAAKAANDGKTRSHLAAIYAWLSQN